MPRVSVIMAVRNGEPWIREAVDSVLTQTHRDLELIVVDDASTDGTSDTLAAIAGAQVRVIRSDEALGAARARNEALRHATGELIAVLDADDAAAPTRIERQVTEFCRRPGLGLLGTWVTLVESDGSPSARVWPEVAGEAIVAWNLLMFSNPLCHSSCMYRRSLIEAVGGYDAAFVPAEDRDLWTRMLSRARVDVLPERLVRMRLHGGSLSARNHAVQRDLSLAIRRRCLAEWTGDHAAAAAIDAWYDAPVSSERAVALARLFDLVITRFESAGDRWATADIAALRADRATRLASLASRTGRRGLLRRLRECMTRLRPGS